MALQDNCLFGARSTGSRSATSIARVWKCGRVVDSIYGDHLRALRVLDAKKGNVGVCLRRRLESRNLFMLVYFHRLLAS